MDHSESRGRAWYPPDVVETAVEYHDGTDTYRTEYHHATRSPSEAVVAVVATATGTDELALPPLYETVDSEDLDSLFVGKNRQTQFTGEVAFDYADCRVRVRSHGTVEVEPLSADEG